MKGALEYGTAAGQGIGCPASGKTGTTEEQSDVWFVGYTPHVSTAVWMGNPDIRTPMPGYGADLAAPIWNDYMTVAATEPCDDFPEPQNPVELSSSSTGYAGDTTDTTDPLDSTDTDTDTPEPGVDADGDGYPDDAYLPGTGDTDTPGNGGPPANTPGNGDPGAGGTP